MAGRARIGARAEMHHLGKSTINQVATLIISAFGFVAALAWNNAIQKVISIFLPAPSETVGLVLYAVIVTVIAVVVTVYLTRLSQQVTAGRK